jgi:hypothetical protein
MQVPEQLKTYSFEQWVKHVRQKTTGAFVFGLFLGVAFTLAFISLAFYYA